MGLEGIIKAGRPLSVAYLRKKLQEVHILARGRVKLALIVLEVISAL